MKPNRLPYLATFFLILLLPALCFGAAYTATQTGPFSGVATWGGGGYPDTSGDTFVIPSGITVYVDGEYQHKLGESDIMGSLVFGIIAGVSEYKLTFGDADLNIAATGRVYFGLSSTSPFCSGNTAELVWETSADNASGISHYAGGKFHTFGQLYGSGVTSSTLAADAENTDNDNDIVTNSDMSGSWRVGDELAIHCKKVYLNYQTDVVLRKINAISGTSISLSASVTVDADVGSVWPAKVIMINRNVRVSKFGYLSAFNQWNTLRPRHIFRGAAGSNDVIFNNVSFAGNYSVNSNLGFGVSGNGAVFRNAGTGLIINAENGSYDGRAKLDVVMIGNYNAFDSLSGFTISGDILASRVGVYQSSHGNTFDCDWFSLYTVGGSFTLNYSTFIRWIYATYEPIGTNVGGLTFENGGFYGCTYTLVWGGINNKFRNWKWGKTPLGGKVPNTGDDW